MPSKARANGEGSIYPYRNGFAAYVWVTTPTGGKRRKYVYGATRDIVHDKWIELHRQATRGPVATKTPTLAAYLEYWLREVVQPNVAPRTAENYHRFARLYLIPDLGSIAGLGRKNIARLNRRDIQTWLNKVGQLCQCCTQGKDSKRPEKRRKCCALGKCCEQRLTPVALRDIRTCLRNALNNAVGDQLIDRNPTLGVKVPAVRRRKRKRWTTEQARQFLESARSDGDPLYAAYVLVLALAMRKGEVLGLPDDAVDFGQQTVDVAWQLQRIAGKLVHRETKTETSDATLPYPTIVGTALRLRLEQRDRDKQAAADAWQEFGLMFTTSYGTPIDPRNFNRSWDARIVKSGVPKISVHDGRRTCGSLLADLDVHPRVAMAILRHARFAITMEVYTEVSDDATRAGLKKLGDSLE